MRGAYRITEKGWEVIEKDVKELEKEHPDLVAQIKKAVEELRDSEEFRKLLLKR